MEQLIRVDGLRAAIRGSKRRATISDGQTERPSDFVERDSFASASNRLWVSDWTHEAMWSGAAYVVFAIYAFTPRIVVRKADTTIKASLVVNALKMAPWPATTGRAKLAAVR